MSVSGYLKQEDPMILFIEKYFAFENNDDANKKKMSRIFHMKNCEFDDIGC